MEMLVTKFSKGKYKNELELFSEPISKDNVKLMGEMIALQALRTVKKYDMKIADKLYIGLIKDLHHMGEIDYIVSDGYDCAQTAMCFLYQFLGRTFHEIYGKDRKGKEITIKLACYREVDRFIDGLRNRPDSHKQVEYIDLWSFCAVNSILNNPTYLGHMAQQRWSSISYKNHKRYKRDESEWITVYNTHEPIITQELWDKVREVEKSVAQGRKTKRGYTHPLSGFLYCADCGGKMKMNSINRNGKVDFNFNCGNHVRLGKSYCFSHFIQAKDIEAIVLDDIRTMAQRIVLDEKTIREEFIRHNAELADKAIKSAKKELQAKRKRTEELSRLMQLAYEDRLKGKMPENICIGFIQKYSEEQKKVDAEIAELEERLTETTNTIQSADEFIRNIKKYLKAPELTREMCYELLDRVVVGGHPKHTGKERVIDIVYKVDIASVLRYKLNK